ncbi:uncharacterized protein LOC128681195 [Plodia interpunctella]|uniref:uncharacterized protein LOC128681195 n=1 Tax=Plodia interpunctella TaxID=58824 RepID=UPI002368A81D|nr:uncharacterized protein LOC128681195 [Plodia interpunctella]
MRVILYCVVCLCVLLVIFLETHADFDMNDLYELYKQSLQLSESAEPKDDMRSKNTTNLDYDLNHTFFHSLDGYQVNATPANEDKYRWVAKVIHSKTEPGPYACTAVCVEKRIFMTAARCIYSLKVDFTSVLYRNQRFPTQAFILPSNQSKQLFDDIGLIVVGKIDAKVKWNIAKLFKKANRTGDNFQWFADLGISANKAVYKVVGYTTEKGLHRIKAADRKFTLSEMPVIIDINMCSYIYTYKYIIRGFFVPCYYSCTRKEFDKNNEKCNNYHGVEGSAIVHMKTGEILGVATWGAYSTRELPVGFSVANSNKFYKDLSCAINIRNDDALLMVRGFYQSLCEHAFK